MDTAAPASTRALPAEGERASFGVMPDGALALEGPGGCWIWPTGEIISCSLFREDADLLPRAEFMRRVAASQAGS